MRSVRIDSSHVVASLGCLRCLLQREAHATSCTPHKLQLYIEVLCNPADAARRWRRRRRRVTAERLVNASAASGGSRLVHEHIELGGEVVDCRGLREREEWW